MWSFTVISCSTLRTWLQWNSRFRVHTADDLSWLSAPSSSSPKPSAISRIKLCATLILTRSPACSKTLFMICKRIKLTKGFPVKIAAAKLVIGNKITNTSINPSSHLNKPLITRSKLLCKFNTTWCNFRLVMVISYVDHILNHPINNDFNICWICHLIEKLKGFALQSVIRVLFRANTMRNKQWYQKPKTKSWLAHAKKRINNRHYSWQK
jgi:hypothetical protein